MSEIRGIDLDAPVRGEYVLHSIEELIELNGLGEIAGGPPVDMDALRDAKEMRPAVFIKDGKYSPELSAAEQLCRGNITDETGDGIQVVSYDPYIGGVYVEGPGHFTVKNAVINLSGDGFGLGGRTSGVAVSEHGSLTVEDSVVCTTGANRCASSAGQGSVLRVERSTLISHGAPYGADAPNGGYTEDSPPEWLEIEGNCRTHCTVDNSWSYFKDCTVICDGWAALSTDMSMGYVYLEAEGCRVVATKNGYGAYVDFCCNGRYKNCSFDTARQGIIMGGKSTAAFTGCDVKCGSYFAFLHCVMGLPVEIGEISVQDSTVRCKQEAFLVKSQNAEISLERADIASEQGVLIHSVKNQDPFATKTFGQKVYGIHVHIADSDTRGDILHEDPEREMRVALRSSTLEGAIRGAALSLDTGSRWFATADSQVVLTGTLDTAQIDAPTGVTIHAKAAALGRYVLASGGELIAEA